MRNGKFGSAWMRGAWCAALAVALCSVAVPEARGEAILQVFNQSHNEIAARLPEIAEAGYTALWVPPPTKANGGMSVGYDLNDPFDIGNSDLRGTWSTRYGVEADLHNLIELCHRFGMRVYFDNVMNHRSYDIPGYNETTPWDVYPGMAPEDFHVRTTSDGFFRKWDNVRDWNDGWQVMFLGLSDLLDIAHETDAKDENGNAFNQNFGATEGSWHIKPKFVRHAYHREDTWRLFDRMPYPGKSNEDYRPGDGSLQNFDDGNEVNLYTGFENRAWNPDDERIAGLIAANREWFIENDAMNGISSTLIENFPNFYAEEVNDYLYRAVRWLVDRTHVDGLRLDAVKHVPYYFYGDDWSEQKDSSNYGYLGQAQWQFNMTRGFNDWDNHRDSVFNIDAPRNDLMAFGEHLGNPPPQGPYVATGMRLVDDRLRNELNWRFSANQLEGFDGEYAGTELGPDCGVMHAQSHDNDYVDRKPLHHAMYFMRRGLGLVYSDGNNHAATLSGSGGAFPRWALTDFLGQWGQRQIPTLLHAHENFARGGQWGRWSQGNFVAWQRGDGGDAAGMTMLFQLNSAWDWWESTKVGGEEFPRETYLYDYASDMYMPYFKDSGPEAAYAMGYDIQDGNINLPPNSYAIWSWKNPDPSDLYPTPYPDCFVDSDARLYAPDSRVITLFENGHVANPVYVTRTDGADGDPNFNPYHVADDDATDFGYRIAIPCITNGTDVSLEVKADGSAEWLHLRLDGGMDFGNWNHQEEGDWRDNPPGVSSDFLLGFENCSPYFNKRMWAELFAAANTRHCKIGTQGATSYEVRTGSTPVVHESGDEQSTDDLKQLGFLYHDPNADSPASSVTGGTTNTTVTTVTRKLNASVNPASGGTVSGAEGFGTVSSVGNYYQDGETCWAGFFSDGSCASGGITGFANDVAYGLYANPAGSAANSEFGGSFTDAAGLTSASVTLGFNWRNVDDGVSYKGFAFLDADGNDIFGVQHGDSDAVNYYGAASGTWSSDYGANAFTVTLTQNANGYRVSGTTRDGGSIAPFDIATGKKIARWKAYMNAGDGENSAFRQLYFNDLTYTASVTNTEVISGVTNICKQFHLEGNTPVIYAKTPKTNGVAAWIYYTTDGDSWPEGAGGVPANTKTMSASGGWFDSGDPDADWWCFTLPAQPSGTVLRYKIGAARVQNEGGETWGSLWPSGGKEVYQKTKMMSHWTIPHLNFLTQQYHKHNDYNSWTTGFKDGYHLVTARMLLNRTDGAAIANTFRQTFYLDTHVPDGRILYPANDHEDVGGYSYGLVVQTDDTVDKVYYHITDNATTNDGPGNGFNTNGVVEWAEATLAGAWTKEMATNTALPKVWKFNYNGIAPESPQEVTIRVRLCEVSSSPTNEWNQADPARDDPDALHVRELTRQVWAKGETKYLYISWPEVDETMVETGWKVWVRFTGNLVAGDNVSPEDVYSWASVYVNTVTNEEISVSNRGDRVSVEWSDFSWPNDWNDGRGECQMAFTMPNVYNGQDDFLYNLTVAIDRNGSAEDSRLIKHKGPLLPTCIITKPPETDSDGAKWVITMEDSVAARTGKRELRETPIVVLTDAEATRLDLQFVSPTDYDASISGRSTVWPTNDVLRLTDVSTAGTTKTWTFAWQVTNAGVYRLNAKVTVDNSAGKYSAPTNGAFRSATVVFKQLVHSTTNNLDWDDDGISNDDETKPAGTPSGNAEYWEQDEIFAYWTTGKTEPTNPDVDGDGLPDGLELGYRNTVAPSNDFSGTDWQADTDGDGWPNFVWDRDPPFYNTYVSWDPNLVPGVKNSTEGGDRLAMVQGSVTDPRNPDSDYDGIPDGLEDANRNGWTDGDGTWLEGYAKEQLENRRGKWPDGKIDSWEAWEETSPCVADSDADGLSDGYGEDKNCNGHCDLALLFSENGTPVPLDPADYAAWGIGVDYCSTANTSFLGDSKPYTSRAINYDALFEAFCVTDPAGSGSKQTNGFPRIVFAETDPLCADTDHDGLPDGWEINYSLDALNNGVYDFRTGKFVTDPTHGPDGNPDGDTVIRDGESVPYDNASEFANGTNPRAYDGASGGGSASGSIVIGAGDPIGTVNDTTFYTEYTQWTLDDLVALDDYNQGGNSSDIYRCGDGFDSSRDMVAFYFHDGGDSSAGGDDKLYFRVDFDDLQAFAESSSLNVYVAINLGKYGNGITDLPDDVNCKTDMGWNAVVGVYDSQNGCFYVQNGGSQSFTPTAGFQGACFNSELDTVAWSIDRTILVKQLGWNGMGDNLLFQVYTTRDFTNDDGGSGDKGGLNDFTDTIGDDWICSDYWNDYNYIAQNGKYSTCVSKANPSGWNNCGNNAKLAMVAHGNQAVEPGNYIQDIVDNGAGAGYGRPVKIHNIYTNCPLNLHITPTLAIALQWAEVGNDKTWFSGPALNEAIKKGVASGAVSLLGSTFSDHIAMYFPDDFNRENVELAESVLESFYGEGAVSSKVLWTPERVADSSWLVRMGRLGYQATVIDQTPHLLEWFSKESPQKGREKALGNDAYKIQRFWINTSGDDWTSVDAFALSTAANNFRYANTDSGLPSDLRHLFLRRARTGEAAISSIFYMWEDFANSANADGYDLNLRWIANHPWIQVVTLDEALADDKLANNVASGNLGITNGMAMQDWVHHACNGNYDNWFYGSDRHESLASKQFEVREGQKISLPWGSPADPYGIFNQTWNAVRGIRNAQVKSLAEATIFASAFETAFHNEDDSALDRWSYGDYMYPAWRWEGLMDMAWRAQSRTRLANVYAAVDEWASGNTGLQSFAADVDLDGEDEFILRNNRVMALFEAEGGVMVGAWFKEDTNVWQMVGNFAAQPEYGYETQRVGPDSRRGTVMKDATVGSGSMVADIFNVTTRTGVLTFKSGSRTKEISLSGADSTVFDISYSGYGSSQKLVIRNGLSPDLATLMLGGQARLAETTETANSLTLTTTSGDHAVSATLRVTTGSIDASATDQPADSGWNTVNLRNAPQVRQVDVTGNGTLAYSIEFGQATTQHEAPGLTVTPEGDQTFPVGATSTFRVTATDWKGDALPVEAELPDGAYWTGTPVWDPASGVFSWKMGSPTSGGRTNDWITSASFSAGDAFGTAETTVTIVVPWDYDGNGIGDDWEYLQCKAAGKPVVPFVPEADDDSDGFSNYAEWVAATNPNSAGSYIGWESQTVSNGVMTLVFQSVPGATYQIEATTAAGLLPPADSWENVATAVVSQGETTSWSDPDYKNHPTRVYRIKIPFASR